MFEHTARPVKVLFIDDDSEDIEIFEENLLEFNPSAQFIAIKDCNKVGKILDAIKGDKVYDHIIFIDVKMPHMSGIDCLKEIRNTRELDKIPIVMFSTFKFEDDIDSSFANKANLYIVKPYQYKSYIKILKEIFTVGWKTTLLNTQKNDFFVDFENQHLHQPGMLKTH